ncbi:hypothetical protein DITRI_Ditri19aG0029500 [Diplodiscus trichospermus]
MYLSTSTEQKLIGKTRRTFDRSTSTEQKLIGKTRRTFDRALCALTVTQHDRIWEPYLVFVSQRGIPIEMMPLLEFIGGI